MKLQYLFLLLFACFSGSLAAQDDRLAQQYFNDGEFEKAAELYEKIYAKSATAFNFNRYYTCLLNIERFDDAEKIIKKRIKDQSNELDLYISYGNLLEKRNQPEAAKEQYNQAVNKLTDNEVTIINLANNFQQAGKYEFALAAYNKGAILLKRDYGFAYEKASVYRMMGEKGLMITAYLDALTAMPSRKDNIIGQFQRFLAESDYPSLQTQLYERIQATPEATVFPEILVWLLTQQKDYKNALRQVKALDKRLLENGSRIYNLAREAYLEQYYDAAIEAYQYIINEKGINSPYYFEAKSGVLNCSRDRVVKGLTYTPQDLKILEQEYERFLAEFKVSNSTLKIVQEYANFQAFYANNLPKAIELLQQALSLNGFSMNTQGELKLDLGDYFLMYGEIWEATLLYSQVDKALKDAHLGEVARFKNAKLAYYKGDFDWAQTQLEALKAATSELIANDAIDLNVFIMEHLNLDTAATPLYQFAQADLLSFQNRFAEAFAVMDSVAAHFPENGLLDDILFKKAEIHLRKREFSQALALLQLIPEKHKEGIWVDNSLFKMAELYENQLQDKAKAMELYQQILLEHTGSTFSIEARKRYRRLRGDDV